MSDTNYVLNVDVQEHNYADWGKPEWEPEQQHWGKHLRCAELEANRLNQTGRIGLSPLSRRVQNARIAECSRAACQECRFENEFQYNPEDFEPTVWSPAWARLMALPHIQAAY